MAESPPDRSSDRRPEGREADSWLRRLLSKGRDEHFTREEQLTIVIVAHVSFLVGVTVIMLRAFGSPASGWPPAGFVICEAILIAGCFFAAFVDAKPLAGWFKKTFGSSEDPDRPARHRPSGARRRFQATVLLLAYVLQFVALVPLLEATGGPIDSPFAPMALAIAIFTPFIANKSWTVCFVVLTAVVFYAVFVDRYGFEPVTLITGPGGVEVSDTRPDPISFAAVNVLILILATTLTLGYQNRLDGRAARANAPGISITRTFDAPPSLVWRAWTEPETLERWLRMDDYRLSSVKLDLRPGGSWGATLSSNGDAMSWNGTYGEVEEPERLVFTISGPGGRGTRTISIGLVEVDGKTRLTLRETHPRYAQVEAAWSAAFDNMADSLRLA